MSKETFVFISGILLVIVPHLGVPETWIKYIISSIGFVLMLIGYVLRRQLYMIRLDKGNGERGNDTYVETTEKLFDDGTLK